MTPRERVWFINGVLLGAAVVVAIAGGIVFL